MGNVRVSYFKNANGSTEVLEENNYYPFGLKHEGYNALVGNPSYQYKYNGKELQTETGWSDYGARMYMADIGRWGVIDPLAETSRRFSPYNYAVNNPISFIDPDGRKIINTDLQFIGGYAPGGAMEYYANGGHGPATADFLYREDPFPDKEVGGGSTTTTIGDIMRSTGITLGSLESYMQMTAVLNLRQQLINAGWDNPEDISAKFDDWFKLVSSKGTSLNEVYRITKARFEEDPNINSPGATSFNLISINMSKNKNLLEYAFTIGHEMYGHVFANLFLRISLVKLQEFQQVAPEHSIFFKK